MCFWHVKVHLINFAKLFPHLLLFVGTEMTLGLNKRRGFSRTSVLSNKTVKETEGTDGGGGRGASLEVSQG